MKSPEEVRIQIEEEISQSLSKLGILFRIFSRCKSQESLQKKLKNPKYGSKYNDINDKKYGEIIKLQDLIGIRVVLYFSDDIEIVHKIINSKYYNLDHDDSIDKPSTNQFEAIRYNLIYKIKDEYDLHIDPKEKIDHTFELQIRSVLSEGWHEVEHDLRYKSSDDWESSTNISRKLNGIYATLETSEWTMLKIFDDLSYKHYKNQNWSAMLRQKFRIRLEEPINLDLSIITVFNNDPEVAKSFFRFSRVSLLEKMNELNISFKINLNSIIFFINLFFIKNKLIDDITPEIFKNEFEMKTDSINEYS